MIDLKKMAGLLAAAPMSDDMRKGYVKLIPQLPEKYAKQLMALLEKHVRDMKHVETEGKKLVANVLDGRKIAAVKKKISSRIG